MPLSDSGGEAQADKRDDGSLAREELPRKDKSVLDTEVRAPNLQGKNTAKPAGAQNKPTMVAFKGWKRVQRLTQNSCAKTGGAQNR